MFTGIIEQTGTVTAINADSRKAKGGSAALTTLTIKAPNLAKKLRTGGSIAVDGACLTVTKIRATGTPALRQGKTALRQEFTVQAIPETLKRTIIKSYRKGTTVNLERPLTLSSPLDGHLVQGHIDAVATITHVKKVGSSTILRIAIPLKLQKYIALKGSITVNGVSLTISGVNKTPSHNHSKKDPKKTAPAPTTPWLEVSLIPETLARTNLLSLTTKSPVNLEVDLVARYLESLTSGS